jgi:hypothetical protein
LRQIAVLSAVGFLGLCDRGGVAFLMDRPRPPLGGTMAGLRRRLYEIWEIPGRPPGVAAILAGAAIGVFRLNRRRYSKLQALSRSARSSSRFSARSAPPWPRNIC